MELVGYKEENGGELEEEEGKGIDCS